MICSEQELRHPGAILKSMHVFDFGLISNFHIKVGGITAEEVDMKICFPQETLDQELILEL